MELSLGSNGLSADRQTRGAEEALVERCRRRDMDAFGKVVDAYQSRVFGFVRRMVKDAEDAADISQEVFIRAYQSFERFDGRSSLRTWLFRIAYNLCVDRSRRVKRAPAIASVDGAFCQDEPIEFADLRTGPVETLLDDELATAVEQGIASMSDKLRTVLLLHDREDLSYEEIARTVGVPVGTVKSRLFLARSHLQSVVKSYLHESEMSN